MSFLGKPTKEDLIEKIASLKKKAKEEQEYEELRKEYSDLKYGKVKKLGKKIMSSLGKMAETQHSIEEKQKKRKKKSF